MDQTSIYDEIVDNALVVTGALIVAVAQYDAASTVAGICGVVGQTVYRHKLQAASVASSGGQPKTVAP